MGKSNDKFLATLKQTELSSWFEVNVVRRTGYYLAHGFNKLGIHPNTVTILSMILGAGSAYFFASGSFHYAGTRGLIYNIIAVGLLYWADILDNTDGQLARLSGKKSKIGRILDGAAGFVWFIPIYLALAWRIYQHHDWEFNALGIENNETNSLIFGILVLILVFYSGFACNGGQQRVSDYYVQAHLYFMRAANGSDLDNSKEQQKAYENLPADAKWWERMFMKTYVSYTQKQERTTPKMQALLAKLVEKYGSLAAVPEELREEMRQESLKVMSHDYIGFMFRAISLAVFVLIDLPLLHFLFETIVLGYATWWLIHHHEAFCEKIMKKL